MVSHAGLLRVGGSHRPPPDGDPPGGDKNDPTKPARPAAPAQPLDALKVKRVTKLVNQMVTAMSTISFLESRPPGRLAADIQTTALLLAVAHRREGMDAEKVDKASASLFRTLFLGGSRGGRCWTSTSRTSPKQPTRCGPPG